MARESRGIVAISVATGERREFDSASSCAIELRTQHTNVLQALNRNGVCCGWKLYDSPESLRKRIEELQRQLKEIEA